MKSLLTTPIACLAAMCLLAGCENKEKVLDIETPAGGIEVEKSNDGVEIDIIKQGE
ncbi:MAG TPA: hypothetical protein PK992_12075 [Planctomycetaceae bacterium]|nr:hypothetical protein [Planctomycetaceae bacterium]